MKTVDLHVHSTRSDGTYSPTQLVDYAVEKGLSAFALTDHDTISGLEEAIRYAHSLYKQGVSLHKQGVEIIPGIELSTERNGRDIHIVGLFIDYQDEGFTNRLQGFIDSRILRNHKMCALLQQAGMDITYEKLTTAFPQAVITRAHYAKYMLIQGYVKSISEAFERYIGDRCPCYVPREKVTPAEAISLILSAGGVPILAHPLLYRLGSVGLDQLVGELKAAGLVGIEAIYPTHSPADERKIRRLADKYHLLISGGSDFHGTNKPGLDLAVGYGHLLVPEEVMTALRRSSHDNLLFTDMDGTLLRDDGTISTKLKAALDHMTGLGHHLILTSGRPLPSILETREALGLNYPNMKIIANNGALIYDCDSHTNIREQRLDPEDVRLLVQAAEAAGLYIHAYTDSHIVCRRETDELRRYTHRIHLPVRFTDDIAAAVPKGSFKLQVIHLTDRSRLEAFRRDIAPRFRERVQFIFSNDQYLELLSAQAGKGSALLYLADYLHAPANHTYAAGDAENDLSMLAAAHTSYAMHNAAPAIKQQVSRITCGDNNHDGLLEILHAHFDS